MNLCGVDGQILGKYLIRWHELREAGGCLGWNDVKT